MTYALYFPNMAWEDMSIEPETANKEGAGVEFPIVGVESRARVENQG